MLENVKIFTQIWLKSWCREARDGREKQTEMIDEGHQIDSHSSSQKVDRTTSKK